MLLTLLKYTIGAFLLIFALREIIKFYKCLRYGIQGIIMLYFPIVGPGLFFTPFGSKEGKDLTVAKKFYRFLGGIDMLAVPGQGTSASLFLISPKAIKEFNSKELKVSIKDDPIKIKFNGFILQNGPKVLKFRSIFSKLFRYENINNLAPYITKIVDRHLRALENKIEKNIGAELELEVREELLSPIFEDVTSLFLFGEEIAENSPKDEDNIPLLTHVREEFGIWLGLLFGSFASDFLFGIPKLLGFLSTTKALEVNAKAEKLINKEYEKRQKMEKKPYSNYFDLVFEHNKKMKAEGNDDEILGRNDAISNCQLFQFAASDTSSQTSISCLVKLAGSEDLQEILWKELKSMPEDYKLVTSDLLDSFEYLRACFKETLRTSCPIPAQIPRKLIRDTKILGKKVYKGDMIMMAPISAHHSPKNFEDPMEFKPERFIKGTQLKMEKRSFVPFGSGPRICVGQYFGEMMVKFVVSRFFRSFKARKIPNKNYDMMMCPTYGYKSPKILISKREF